MSNLLSTQMTRFKVVYIHFTLFKMLLIYEDDLLSVLTFMKLL